MNINKQLARWRKTKNIGIANDICSALVEMLEDEDSEVINHALVKPQIAYITFENDDNEFMLVKVNRADNFKRMKVLEEENGKS